MNDPKDTGRFPDEFFARVAVGRRFVTLGALGECLAAMRKMGEAGRKPLSATMLQRGVLTREEVETILAVARAGELSLRYIEDLAIMTKIGEGGMGAVYAAMDVGSCELCAMKVLPKDLAREKALVKRFKREAEVAVGLDHPNIVCGTRTGEAKGVHYFAMEFVDGETVYDRLEREGSIPEGDVLRIVRGTCLGLQYAADHGLVHRDIKPENIIVAHDGTPKLLDLGLVKKADTSRVSRLTQDGMAIGTPHYISPEQARGEHDVDGRSDIYALGATAYHMVTGKVPFEGNTAAVIMTKHLTEELDWPSDVDADVSEHTSRLISKMMAKEPHNRYQRAEHVAADIDLILSGKAPSGEILPPGASSIRGAVKMSRAIERAARKQRERTESGTTAVHERIKKRQGVALVQVLQQHRKLMVPVAAGLFAVAILVLAIALGDGEEPVDGLPGLPPTLPATVPAPDTDPPRPGRGGGDLLVRHLERLMNAEVERIPELIDALSGYEDLTSEEARLVYAAKRNARGRFDAEADRRLRHVLSREKRGLIDREEALGELEAMQKTFARSTVLPRIMASIADHGAPPRPQAPGIRAVPLVAAADDAARKVGFDGSPDEMASGLDGWRMYGDWRLDTGEIVFRFDPEKRYSHALQSPLGFGECSFSCEIRTDGGERAAIALWEQATEDTEGKPEADKDSAVTVRIGGPALAPARGRWARLEMAAGPVGPEAGTGLRASLDGQPLAAERTGRLSHGRVTFSFEGGVWRMRRLSVLPVLADGEAVYEVGFDRDEPHGWKGRVVRTSVGPDLPGDARKTSLAAVRAPGEWGAWASVEGEGIGVDRKPLFKLADGMRLALAFRGDLMTELKSRLVAGGRTYELRLSGRPPQRQWTALTVPLADFRSEAGESPPAGADVTALSIGAPGAQPELLISLVRLVR
jgi:serine/threonine-protein kinase